MNWKLKSTSDLSSLEANVATAAQAVAETKAATRATWDKVKDFRAAIDDAPDSPALAAGLREAETAHRTARDKDEASQAALLACERALVAAREAPVRAALDKKLKGHSHHLPELRENLLPHLVALRDELWAAYYPEIIGRIGGADTHAVGQLVQTVDALVEQLGDGRIDRFGKHLAAHADAIADGTLSVRLGSNLHERHADLAAWRATDQAIVDLTKVG
jgi:hypothetical protein